MFNKIWANKTSLGQLKSTIYKHGGPVYKKLKRKVCIHIKFKTTSVCITIAFLNELSKLLLATAVETSALH